MTERVRDILRNIVFSTMQDAKEALLHLLAIQALRPPSINDLLLYLNMKPIEGGDDWCWPGLYYDILSNKYGACAKFDRRRQRTRFVLYLPPVEHCVKFRVESDDILKEDPTCTTTSNTTNDSVWS